MNSMLVKMQLSEDAYILIDLNLDFKLVSLINVICNEFNLSKDVLFAFIVENEVITNYRSNEFISKKVKDLKLFLDSEFTLILKDDFVYSFTCEVIDCSSNIINDYVIINKKGSIFFIKKQKFNVNLYSPVMFKNECDNLNLDKEVLNKLIFYFDIFVNFYRIISLSDALNMVSYYEDRDVSIYINEIEILKHYIGNFFIAAAQEFNLEANEYYILNEYYFKVDGININQLILKQKEYNYHLLDRKELQKFKHPFFFPLTKEFSELLEYLATLGKFDEKTISELSYELHENMQDELQTSSTVKFLLNNYGISVNYDIFNVLYLNTVKKIRMYRYRGNTKEELSKNKVIVNNEYIEFEELIANLKLPTYLKKELIETLRGVKDE